MKKKFYSVAIIALLFSIRIFAVEHTITVSTYSFSPSTLTVGVGDTVTWTGDLGFHPVVSTSVPNGAANFSSVGGNTFSYVVTQAGAYNYQCDNHGTTFNMKGSFTALGPATVAETNQVPSVGLNFRKGMIAMSFASAGTYDIRINNILGQPVFNEEIQIESGHNINTDAYQAGVYVLNISNGGKAIVTRKFIVR